jgi:hypothetical protein
VDTSSNSLFKQLEDALRDYEYYEETTTSKPVGNSVGNFVDPVTTLVNETNRLMLDLNNKYQESAAEVGSMENFLKIRFRGRKLINFHAFETGFFCSIK